jgi:hypothetical protein
MTIHRLETAYDYGFKGASDTVYGMAMISAYTKDKEPLLKGCVDAFSAGRHKNLRAFFAGYMHTKLQGIAVPGDRILQEYMLQPMQAAVTGSPKPYNTLDFLLGAMTTEDRKASIDLLLRDACARGDVKMARMTLELGADAKTNKHSAVLGVAASKLPEETKKELLHVLHVWGAELDKACTLPVKQADYLKSLQKEFYEKKISASPAAPETEKPAAAPTQEAKAEAAPPAETKQEPKKRLSGIRGLLKRRP